MKMLLPPYIVHHIALIIYLGLEEWIRDFEFNFGCGYDTVNKEWPLELTAYAECGKEGVTQEEFEGMVQKFHFMYSTVHIFMILCGLVNTINMYTFVRQSYELGFLVMTRMWSIIDLFIIILNFNIVLELVTSFQTIYMRQIEAALFILMWFKSLYFLALIGQIAPLVDIIFVILRDIKYFTAIFIIALIAFINAFYLIGKNQKELATSPEEIPPYATWVDAAHHVYTSSLGEFDTGFYFNNPMSVWLIILFTCMSFFMCIHMLNMLIAIMGESFANNNIVAESKKRISQLAFVVDNWWIDPLENKEKIVYIICAFS